MTRPLEGVRVLDFSRVLAGPFCSMVLADLGADIIKVERPGKGDDLRGWGPPFLADGESTYFLAVNRNKRSITIDLKSEDGAKTAARLAEQCDVVLENFIVGTMEKFGLGYEHLRKANPRLVYCSISGYGNNGPLYRRPGYDIVVQGMSGLMSVTGERNGDPMRVGVAIVDIITGLYSAIGILGALSARATSGAGQRVDTSLLEGSLAIMPNLTSAFLLADVLPDRFGNGHPNAVPYKTFPTQDGFVTLAIGNDEQWVRFCRALGLPDYAQDRRFASNADRVQRRDEVDHMVTEWLGNKTTDVLINSLQAAEVPCGPIYTLDKILGNPQVEALNIIKSIQHPTSGALKLIGAPFRMSQSDTDPYAAPPLIGQHSDEILREVLAMTEAEIRALRETGALGDVEDRAGQVPRKLRGSA